MVRVMYCQLCYTLYATQLGHSLNSIYLPWLLNIAPFVLWIKRVT